MKSVYFHIDEVARDAVVASALKKHLAKHGISLVYGNRRQIKLFRKLYIPFPFDLAVFPNVDLVESTFRDVEKIDFPILVLPTETISGRHDTSNRLATHLLGSNRLDYSGRAILDKITRFCLWGSSHLETLNNYAPLLAQRAIIVGHPRYDLLCLKKRDSNRVEHRQKKKVGLITRFDTINIFDDRSNLVTAYSSRKLPGLPLQYFQTKELDIEDSWHNTILDLRIFFNIIDSIDINAYEITLRIHPRENRVNWERLVKSQSLPVTIAPWDQPFAHWASDQDILIAPPSTSFYDLAMIGKHAISIQNIEPKRASHASPVLDDFDPIFNYFQRPSSLTELYKDMSDSQPSAQSPELWKVVNRETDFPECSSSLAKVASVISGALESQPPKKKVWASSLYFFGREMDALLFKLQKIARNKDEQSANFPLGWSRRKFIDALSI